MSLKTHRPVHRCEKDFSLKSNKFAVHWSHYETVALYQLPDSTLCLSFVSGSHSHYPWLGLGWSWCQSEAGSCQSRGRLHSTIWSSWCLVSACFCELMFHNEYAKSDQQTNGLPSDALTRQNAFQVQFSDLVWQHVICQHLFVSYATIMRWLRLINSICLNTESTESRIPIRPNCSE